MTGALVCRMHGGSSPQVRRKAEQRQAVEVVRREAIRLGRSIDVDPLDAMLEQVREAAANVAALRGAVEHLDPGMGLVSAPEYVMRDVVSGFDPEVRRDRLERVEGIYGPNHTGDGVPHVLVTMYGTERDRLVKYAKLCLDAGVDERRIRLAEATGRALAGVVEAAVTAALDSVKAAGLEVEGPVLRDVLDAARSSAVAAAERSMRALRAAEQAEADTA